MRGRRGAVAGATVGNPLQMPLWSARDAGGGWNVRISRRARRMALRVFPGGRVEVVVPPGVGIPAVERFVSQHREWAERRAREFALLAPDAASVVDTGEGVLQLRLARDGHAEVSRVLLRWLAGVAVVELGARLDEAARDTGIDYSRMLLRRQRTRWGSCSSTGSISLNLCLAFQAPDVVRYLLIHELCHRRHMNHSARFWRLVGTFEPDWKRLDAELLKGWRNVPAWVFPS
jgi:predicted metal-dependent hydrolase